MYETLKSSTTIWTPSLSTTTSSWRRWSSKAMPYCIPEQPPPLTKMRRASCRFSLPFRGEGQGEGLGGELPPAQLEPLLLALGLARGGTGDHPGQLLHP